MLGGGLPRLVGGAQLPPTTIRQSLEGSLPPSPWLISLLHHGLALCRGPPAVNSVVRQLHRPTTNTAAVLPKLANNMADNPMFSHCPAELVEELVANSSLPEEQRRSPRDWLQLLITCASQYPEWDKELPLLELGRRLARREALDGLSDEEAMSYWTSLDKLAATFQTSQSCGALTRCGKRCQVPGRAGSLTCGNARHKSQGMPLLVRDRDGESGHTRTGDFVCQGCGEDGDDHAEPGEYVDCITCAASINLRCAMELYGGDIPENTEVQCGWCHSHRANLPLLLSSHDEGGAPAMPPVAVIRNGPPRPSVQGPRSSPAPVQPNAPEALSPGPSPVLPQQSGGEAAGPRPPAASSNTDAKIAALTEKVAKLARSVEELHRTQAPLATVTREPITTSTQGETSTTFSVPLARFAGTKAGTDAQGRAPSASQHFLNDRSAASWDLLCLVTDEKSKQFRENLGYVEPPTGQPPEYVRLVNVNYWRESLAYLWKLLHIDTGDFQPVTEEGRARQTRVLTIMARIKWLRAVQEGLMMRSVPGEEPLSHPIIYKYLVKLYHTELQGRDVQLFSQFWGRVVDQLRQMVRVGE